MGCRKLNADEWERHSRTGLLIPRRAPLVTPRPTWHPTVWPKIYREPQMAATLAQSIPAVVHVASANSLASTAFGSNPTVGNYVIAFAWGWSSSTPAVNNSTFTDTGGNSWTTYGQSILNDLWLLVGWMKVATSGASFKTTWNRGGAPWGSPSIIVVQMEVAGIVSSSPVDGTPTGTTGTTGVPAPGSMSFTNGSFVASCFVAGQTTYTTFGYATPTNFTRAGFETDGSTYEVGEGSYWLAGTSATNPSYKTGTVKWACQQFALLPTAAAATQPPYDTAHSPQHQATMAM